MSDNVDVIGALTQAGWQEAIASDMNNAGTAFAQVFTLNAPVSLLVTSLSGNDRFGHFIGEEEFALDGVSYLEGEACVSFRGRDDSGVIGVEMKLAAAVTHFKGFEEYLGSLLMEQDFMDDTLASAMRQTAQSEADAEDAATINNDNPLWGTW